jgi:hypothetical protein
MNNLKAENIHQKQTRIRGKTDKAGKAGKVDFNVYPFTLCQVAN